MIYKKIRLNTQIEDVTLQTYIPDASSDYQKARKRPAIIVCPGGAYQFLSEREGEPVAMRYASEGYAAFVLHYHVGLDENTVQPQPLQDLGRAMLYVREHAEKWRIDSERISICGFSAGGHLCAAYASMWHEKWLALELEQKNSSLLKPAAAVMGYSMTDMLLNEQNRQKCPTKLMNEANVAMFGCGEPEEELLRKYSPVHHINSKTVPCFLWHTSLDELVDVRNSLHMAERLSENGIPFQLLIYPFGQHGLALSNAATDCGEGSVRSDAEGWFTAMLEFLEQIYFYHESA